MEKTTEFQWTDELVNEFAGYWNDKMNPSKISLSDIEKFKQSKVKKEEPKQSGMEIQKGLHHGLYKINWVSGGQSYASIGMTYDGTNWFAPCNWTSESNDNPIVASTKWEDVKSIELIKDYCYDKREVEVQLPKESPLPIKVEIKHLQYNGKKIEGLNNHFEYNFCLNIPEIPSEKYEPIKKAIESVLNNGYSVGYDLNSYTEGYAMGYKTAQKYNQQGSTAMDILVAQEQGYNKAIDTAVSIVESEFDTINYGNKATQNPKVLCNQIISFLNKTKFNH